MSSPPKTPVFLGRASYRQRRLRDAARLVPVLGLILWLIPLLWSNGQSDSPGNADAVIYIFGVWVCLIIVTAVISAALRSDEAHDPTD